MKFLDLFAGIGGFRLGLEQAGHECVGYVEWDKCARKSYEAIHDTEGEWTAHDITTVTDEQWRELRGRVDIICGGFPCQPFSIAGKRRSFKDTRGNMFFEIARATKEIKPRYLFLENVKGLLSSEKGETFRVILHTLDELGYDCEWQVLNTKDFSTKERPTPQNRERVFIVGHLRGTGRPEVFPIGRENEEIGCNLVGMLDIKGKDQIRRVYDVDGISPTLTTMQGGGQEPKIIVHNFPQLVKIRKHEVDIEGLKTVLKSTKQKANVTISKIANALGQPKTKVEHWFRNDSSFSIPEAEIWFELKDLINIETTDFDASITEFIEKENEFEKGNRVYDEKGIAPTITSTTADEKILVRHGIAIKEATKKGYDIAYPGDSVNYSVPTSKTRRGRVGDGIANTLDTGCQQDVVTEEYDIRKLTPRECWRLQGFPDLAFDKAQEVNSDSQLYKQAGNSVSVPVIYEIGKRLI